MKFLKMSLTEFLKLIWTEMTRPLTKEEKMEQDAIENGEMDL